MILAAALAIVAVGIIAVTLANRQVPKDDLAGNDGAALKIGERAPNFAVQSSSGRFELDNAATPVLLVVFATWCPHCQFEVAALNDVCARYRGHLAVIAVNGDPFDIQHRGAVSQADVNTFARRFHVRYPIAYDPNLSVAQTYLGSGYPMLVLVGKDKTIAWKNAGAIDESALLSHVAAVVR